MKRKNWRVNTEHSSRIGPSFHKGAHEVLDSKSRLNDSATPENQDIGCKRRVRFRDLDSCKLQESASVPQGRIQDPRSDEPKTSEYAFFKKLKKDAHRLHSGSEHQDKSQSINLKGSHYSRGRIDVIHTWLCLACKIFSPCAERSIKAPMPLNVTPDNLFQCISTPDSASQKSEVHMKRAGTTSSDIHNLQENMEQYGAPSKNASVFSRKRHKLHQLVAKTLFLEVDELFSKGHDIVSVLLSKLFPESNRNKSFENLKTGTLDIDTESELFTSPEFDIHINESQWKPAIKFMGLECQPSLDVGFSSCWTEILKTKELPNPNISKCCSRGTFLGKRMALDFERAPPILFTECDSALDLGIRKHQRLTSRDLKELDEFHCSIKPLHGQEPQTLLLGWDADDMVDESNLSRVSQNRELSLHPFLSSLYADDQQKNPDDSFTKNEFHYPIKPLHGRETQNLLLGWDVDDMDNKSNLSTTSQITELSLNCFLPSSHCNDQEKNLDDSFIASTLCTKSLVSYHPPTSENTELSLNCFLSGLCSDDQKRNFDDIFTESRLCTESLTSYHPSQLSLEFSSLARNKSHEKDDIYAENCFSSCSHDMTNQLNMSKASNYGTTCSGSNTFPSPLNQLSFRRKNLNERQPYPDKEPLSSAGFDFYIKPLCKPVSGSSSDHYLQSYYALECPESEHLFSYLIGDANERRHLSHRGISKHLCDDMIDTHNWSSNYFQIALDKDKSHPLMLDKPHWDESNGEIF